MLEAAHRRRQARCAAEGSAVRRETPRDAARRQTQRGPSSELTGRGVWWRNHLADSHLTEILIGQTAESMPRSCAAGGIRTRTIRRSARCEPAASTSSATAALWAVGGYRCGRRADRACIAAGWRGHDCAMKRDSRHRFIASAIEIAAVGSTPRVQLGGERRRSLERGGRRAAPFAAREPREGECRSKLAEGTMQTRFAERIDGPRELTRKRTTPAVAPVRPASAGRASPPSAPMRAPAHPP